MWKKIIFFVFFFILILGYKNTSHNQTEESEQYYTVDGFEFPGEWKVDFSKFRSIVWDPYENPSEKREPSSQWYNWFVTGENGFKPKEILPSFILKNIERFPNEKTILGIRTKWSNKGKNWIFIRPVNLESPPMPDRYGPKNIGRYPDQKISNSSLGDRVYTKYSGSNYILLAGRTEELSIYVWGSFYKYRLEFHVEDYRGQVHVIDAGSLDFHGWRRMTASVPNSALQFSKYLPRPLPLKFKGIQLVLNHNERLTGTYVYLDYLHAHTRTYLKDFFGERLENSDRIWKRNKNEGQSSQ